MFKTLFKHKIAEIALDNMFNGLIDGFKPYYKFNIGQEYVLLSVSFEYGYLTQYVCFSQVTIVNVTSTEVTFKFGWVLFERITDNSNNLVHNSELSMIDDVDKTITVDYNSITKSKKW